MFHSDACRHNTRIQALSLPRLLSVRIYHYELQFQVFFFWKIRTVLSSVSLFTRKLYTFSRCSGMNDDDWETSSLSAALGKLFEA